VFFDVCLGGRVSLVRGVVRVCSFVVSRSLGPTPSWRRMLNCTVGGVGVVSRRVSVFFVRCFVVGVEQGGLSARRPVCGASLSGGGETLVEGGLGLGVSGGRIRFVFVWSLVVFGGFFRGGICLV